MQGLEIEAAQGHGHVGEPARLCSPPATIILGTRFEELEEELR